LRRDSHDIKWCAVDGTALSFVGPEVLPELVLANLALEAVKLLHFRGPPLLWRGKFIVL
jgi:hypothetical protein